MSREVQLLPVVQSVRHKSSRNVRSYSKEHRKRITHSTKYNAHVFELVRLFFCYAHMPQLTGVFDDGADDCDITRRRG